MKVGWHHHATAQKVDLGEEPPLVVGPTGPEAFGRRSVSIRWLTGTVLTGITSIVLMGGALIGSLDGRYSITLPAAAHIGEFAPYASQTGLATKGDLIKPAAEEFSNKQIVEVSTVTRQGERNLIKKQPYALVTASLITRASDIAEDIPPFNPLSIFADTTVFPSRAATDAIYDAQVDGEITITEQDFPTGHQLAYAPSATMSADEAEAQLREQQWFDGTASVEFANTSLASDHRFDFAFADPRNLGDTEISIVPENVSELIKRDDETGSVGSADEVIALVAKGDTLEDVLSEYGADPDAVEAIHAVLRDQWNLEEVSAGQTVRMEVERIGFDGNARVQPVRVSIYDDASHLATVAMTDAAEFVAAEPPADAEPGVQVASVKQQQSPRQQGSAPSVYDSLYQTAREHEVPEDLIDDIVRTFSFDVDFNGNVRAGDQFTVFYAVPDEKADVEAPSEVLYAALTAGGVERRFYRFRTPDDGSVDFYDESGKSAKKFLMRKPMARGVFRSGFGYRRHPILGYSKLHSGVDWAAPRRTPIFASGNGTIKEIGWKSGYGRWTLIKHANGYESGYAHQSGFADGLEKGSKVRQGQVIGYVGSTGLSTGPHLHYEVHVNGRPVDPLRIRLPRGRELTGDVLATFERERDRIDALIQREIPSEAKVASR
ncbi:M23 family metallopeptidase [Amorphus orientalis]|uniref:Murein DD-endopeptidase MepM/ murein hydrolase activator NlpD n=1 Tax=Amorphus orientalis TaxID=649198 RepID=A0AAE4ARE3_9HYPH|nr:M23 family metallopeptidase [Amorphus orientalis]MDQ0313918.1 murein DD-endopeptidase MepM/ murein hydrolase activator NlpD [Amorphus orientalis]